MVVEEEDEEDDLYDAQKISDPVDQMEEDRGAAVNLMSPLLS